MAAIPEDVLERYDQVIALEPGLTRKGAMKPKPTTRTRG
jgi:hypothetical protein